MVVVAMMVGMVAVMTRVMIALAVTGELVYSIQCGSQPYGITDYSGGVDGCDCGGSDR